MFVSLIGSLKFNMSTREAAQALGLGHPLFTWNLRGRPKPGGGVEACNTGMLFSSMMVVNYLAFLLFLQ